MIIENKVAVVTGATGGIGFAVCEKLIEKGVKGLAVVDQSPQCFDIASKLNTASGASIAMGFEGDVTDNGFRKHVFDTMQEKFGCIVICVPAAGILRDAMAIKINRQSGKAEIYDEDLFKKVLEVNLMHPTYWAMQMMAGIAEHRAAAGLGRWQAEEPIQGATVLIGSVSSRGNRGQVSYSASKSGLNAVCTTLNIEGLYHGIQTKIIHPGFVDTPMVASMPENYFEENLKSQIGLGRLIAPQEIAEAIICLIENPIISGQLWADASLRSMI